MPYTASTSMLMFCFSTILVHFGYDLEVRLLEQGRDGFPGNHVSIWPDGREKDLPIVRSPYGLCYQRRDVDSLQYACAFLLSGGLINRIGNLRHVSNSLGGAKGRLTTSFSTGNPRRFSIVVSDSIPKPSVRPLKIHERGQLTMRDQRIHLFGPCIPQHLCCQLDRVSRINHVVYQDGDPALDIANEQFHLFDHSCLFFIIVTSGIGSRGCRRNSREGSCWDIPLPFPVDEGKVEVELVGQSRGTVEV